MCYFLHLPRFLFFFLSLFFFAHSAYHLLLDPFTNPSHTMNTTQHELEASLTPTYPAHVFTGVFNQDSSEFQAAWCHSGVVLGPDGLWQTYAVIVAYHATCLMSTTYDLFTIGHPATILTGEHTPFGSPTALYAMVRGMQTWSCNDPCFIMHTVSMEVHVEPGFVLNWSLTTPWPSAPLGAVYIHPHPFQEPGHRPARLSSQSQPLAIYIVYNVDDLHQRILHELIPAGSIAPIRDSRPLRLSELIAPVNDNIGKFVSMIVRPFSSRPP